MKTASAKAKGRRAAAEVREMLLAAAPKLQADDIQVKATSVPGEDLWLSPAARAVYPFAIEVKNQEALSVWDALRQAETHAGKIKGATPLLVFRRNRTGLYAALKFEDFLRLLARLP